MAIRPDRVIEMTDCLHVLNDVSSKGVVLCFKTAGSGVALGDSHGIVQLAASPSGLVPAGLLLQDFVNIDETRFHINWNKEEQNIGDYCDMATKGWVVTNQYTGSPVEGNKAYLTANGQVTPTVSATGGTAATPLVGRFMGSPDELGFVKLGFNLPQLA